jgi:N-acetylglucosaminyl-diphospho-decaprenol L-rhamnosyltransferase
VSPAVSVIVLNFNGRSWLGPCLTAVQAQIDSPPYEIIVADNGSSDDSLAFVASAFPTVRIIDNRRNLGFAAGNNAAARAARGDLLVFLNNDTIPAANWLSRLHAAYVAAPAPALVTSRLVFMDRPDLVDSAGDGYLRAGGAYKRGHGRAAHEAGQSGEVFGACGAAFMIERTFFDRLGGFDARFFMVYEDVDLSYRARLAGGRCWYAADAVVRHAGSATLGRASRNAVFHGQRNLEWVWVKNTPGGLLWRTLPAHVVYSLAGVVHYAIAGLGGPAIRGKLAALGELPRVIGDRRAVQRRRVVDVPAIEQWLDRGWLQRKRGEKTVMPQRQA